MANIAIVNSKIAALNADQALTFTATNEDGAGVAQTMVYTPTGKDNKIVIGIVNGVAATETITYTIAAGEGVFGAAAKTGTVAAASTDIIQIETGKYMQANGTILVSLDPTNVLKKLTTDHVAKVFAIELQ